MTSALVSPDGDYQRFLDEPVPVGIDMYDPATGRRCRTRREYYDAMARPRHVALTDVRWKRHTLTVSTIHTIHDYSFGISGTPVVYETMVFGAIHKLPAAGRCECDDLGEFQARYSCAAEAREGHQLMVTAITKTLVYDGGHTVVRSERPETLIDAADPEPAPAERPYYYAAWRR